MKLLLKICLCAWLCLVVATAFNESAKPLSLPPSGYWEGNDGQWSTFDVQVGSPAQVVRLLPGTSATAANVMWVVLIEGCEQANPNISLSDCTFARGGLFDRNSSLTWSTSRLENEGLYEIVLYEENKLGLSANAYYGFDTISFGLPDSGLPQLENQIIAGIATNDFFLGTLALSPISQNFTSYAQGSVPSLLGTLRNPNSSLVPSTTWAYTAGAVYKDPPVFGSVTFGGYDTNRIDLNQSKSVSVPFFTDPSRDLLLGLQSITYDSLGSSPLLADGIYVFIDSLVAQMWLPLEVCQAFETAFGLEWDNSTELYLVSEQTHASLVSQNPSFAFTVGPSKSQGSSNTVIYIPYAAFDLNISTPYYNESRRYFPLKRAQNDTQFTLGRSFLQEAYVIADYERNNFTVGQALFPATSNIVPILPSGLLIKRASMIGTGAIVGIIIGVVVVVAVAVSVLIWRRRYRKGAYSPALTYEMLHTERGGERLYQNAEADESEVIELRGDAQYSTSAKISTKHAHRWSELSGSTSYSYELPVHDRYELADGSVAANELESPRLR